MLFDQAIDMPAALQTERLNVTLVDEKVRYNLRLKASDFAAIKKETGLKLPAKIGGSSIGKEIICVKLGPDEWVVIADPKQKETSSQSLDKISKDYVCSVTEISHRNVAFEISGVDASKLVSIGCPLDLSLGTFPVGRASRTIFESATIMLLRMDEDRYIIECWRSFGPYLRDYFMRVVTT